MMTSRKLYSLLPALLITLGAMPLSAGEAFRVCADPLHPPYSMKDGSGFENQIAALFAKTLGQPLEYTWFPDRIGFIRNTLKAQKPKSEEYLCDVVIGVPAEFDQVLTTRPYYHSTYVLVIALGRGWDDITTPAQLASVSNERRNRLKIAMFDRGPGTAWLKQNNLLDIAIPYQSISGDHERNTTLTIAHDLAEGKIDMIILWGPMAGYLVTHHPDRYRVLPMPSTPGMKFDFSIAMGVRHGDAARKAQLEQLIEQKQGEINAILQAHHVPLLPIPARVVRDDD